MGRGCDPRGRPYTTFRDAIKMPGSKTLMTAELGYFDH